MPKENSSMIIGENDIYSNMVENEIYILV